MKFKIMPFVIAAVLVTVANLHGQESVCDLFSHLQSADGKQSIISGDLIISKDSAALGAAACDHRYIAPVRGVPNQFPTALSLYPSGRVTSAHLREFQNAGIEADRLRTEGKVVRASASFSGRIRVASVGKLPAELVFDSFDNLKVEALPDNSLTVLSICDLFQNLSQSDGKRIAVRGELVSTFEGTWITGRCKGAFVTDNYRWPVSLTLAIPAYYSQQNAALYEAKWPTAPKGTALHSTSYVPKTATFVGLVHMRSEYHVVCRPGGHYLGNGFGHLNGAAAELIVDTVMNLALTQQPEDDSLHTEEQRCTPPDFATLCSNADSLVRAASIGCTDRVREFLAKDGIDGKNGSESMSLRAAILSGNEPVVKLLLDAGAPLDPVEAMRSPLAEAAFARQIGIMKLLLAAGAKVNSVDHHGDTFLVDSGIFDPRVIKVLVEAGTNVDTTNGNGETALMKASGLGFAEQTIKVLIEHHADLNLKDNKGRTAVMHAAASCCSDAIPLLLENGADPNSRDNEGKTALDLANSSNNLAAIAVLSVATRRPH
jgi:ankyrin repeat protein